MIAQASSVDARQDLVVDARTMNEGDGRAGSGSNPWHLDKSTESVLYLADEGAAPARIGLSITAGGVHYYLTELQLAPGETRAINIRHLRAAGIADFKGHMIPANATDGSIDWIRLDNVPVSGRVMVISRGQGVASSYDCYNCPCPANYSMDGMVISPANFDFTPVNNYQLAAAVYYINCNGDGYYADPGSCNWSSSDTSIATVDNNGVATAVAAGTATIWASAGGTVYEEQGYNPPSCTAVPQSFQGSGTANVLTVSQSPSQFNMSTGDTDSINVSVVPDTVSVTTSFSGTGSATSNPDSSCGATLTVPGQSGSGNIASNVTASAAGCSGVFSVTASANGATSSNSTTVDIPPQVLIQMMYGEAGCCGSEAQLAVGVTARNRFGNPYFSGDTNFQNTIVSTQFNGIDTSVTTGVSPELGNSVEVWLTEVGDIVTPSGGSSSGCFWTPSSTEWSEISAAVQSGTTDESQVPNRTGCYSGAPYGQQIRVVTAVGGNSSGVPWFVFQGPRPSASSPVAVEF